MSTYIKKNKNSIAVSHILSAKKLIKYNAQISPIMRHRKFAKQYIITCDPKYGNYSGMGNRLSWISVS